MRDYTNNLHAYKIRIALPWFRVHSILLNDPGRLLSVHLLIRLANHAGLDLVYELLHWMSDMAPSIYPPPRDVLDATPIILRSR